MLSAKPDTTNTDICGFYLLIDRTIPAFTNALRTSPHLAFTLE